LTEELGKIEKPEAEQFADKRKLFLVPLLYSWPDAPDEYKAKLDVYWQQVSDNLVNLESKVGRINRIYHESIGVTGEEALRLLEKLNPASGKITSEKVKGGAQIEPVEDTELVEENMDWERHLMMGFISEKVARKISEFFSDTSKKRYEYIANKINGTLKSSEVAILFIREGHQVQFAPDIEVFSVFPPVLDDIMRWLRDYKPPEKTEEKKE
jgi:hypothetical protein